MSAPDSIPITHAGGAPDIERALAQFDTVSLPELQRGALLDRVDTKFVFGASQLADMLGALTAQYRVLSIDGARSNRYQTLYFDTGDFDLYRHHHNSLSSRYKVRERHYVGSDLSFLEVKHRTNQNRTVKTRLQIPGVDPQLDGQATDFVGLHTPLDASALEPKLWNDYRRITLAGIYTQERVTLDLDLSFTWGDRSRNLPGVAIAEVKQDRVRLDSPFIQQMRRFGIRSGGLSKYCAGVCLLYDGVKSNNFKPRLRDVAKVIQKEMAHDYVH